MLRKQILLLGNKKCFCHGVKNIFASRTQILRPKHMFPSLATPGNIARNIVSSTMFPSLARLLGHRSLSKASIKMGELARWYFNPFYHHFVRRWKRAMNAPAVTRNLSRNPTC